MRKKLLSLALFLFLSTSLYAQVQEEPNSGTPVEEAGDPMDAPQNEDPNEIEGELNNNSADPNEIEQELNNADDPSEINEEGSQEEGVEDTQSEEEQQERERLERERQEQEERERLEREQQEQEERERLERERNASNEEENMDEISKTIQYNGDQEIARLYRPQNVVSSVLAEKFSNMNRGIKITDYPEANSFILEGSKSDIDLAIQQLDMLDIPQKMISIDFMVIEYFHGDDFDWSFDITQGRFGNFNEIGFTTGATQGISFLYNGITRLSPIFRMNLTALVSENKAKIVTNPHLTVQSGEQAILDIDEEVFVTLSEVNNQTGLIIQRIQKIAAGINLDITPTCMNDSTVSLKVVGEISEFLPFSTDGNYRKDVNMVNTSVDIKVGETLIVGGIVKEQYNTIDAGFPFLSKIPGIGYLFKRKKSIKDYVERVVYITPRVFTTDEMGVEESFARYEETRKPTDLEKAVSERIETDNEIINYTFTNNVFERSRKRRIRRAKLRRGSSTNED